jgi:Protein of unknown function (DUF1254)
MKRSVVKSVLFDGALVGLLACERQAADPENSAGRPAGEYEFKGGFPTPETVQRAYDDADLNRAIQAYKFFYPTVSFEGTWRGNLKGGVVPNKVFAMLEGNPRQLVFTPNSDTPYAGLALDLSIGPIVVELPPGPLMCSANDLNQRWVMDMSLPGPDAGKRRQASHSPARLQGRGAERLLHRCSEHQSCIDPASRLADTRQHARSRRKDESGQDPSTQSENGMGRARVG